MAAMALAQPPSSGSSDEVLRDTLDVSVPITLSATMGGDAEEAEEPHTSRPRLCGQGPLTSRLRWYGPPRRKYSRRELLADRIILWGGAAMSFVAVPWLMYTSNLAGDAFVKQAGFAAFGAGLILMLTCSAVFHFMCWRWDIAEKLLCLDHIGISSMIMGTYVPVMQMVAAWVTLGVVLGLGVLGYLIEVYKFLVPQKIKDGVDCMGYFQIARYLVMGWACVLVMGQLWVVLPRAAVACYFVGGVTYSVGVLAFVQQNMEYHTAIWHFAVLFASVSMFIANVLLVGLPLPE